MSKASDLTPTPKAGTCELPSIDWEYKTSPAIPQVFVLGIWHTVVLNKLFKKG